MSALAEQQSVHFGVLYKKDVPAAELGALVVKEAVSRAGIKPEQVDEVIFGNVLQAGLGQNVCPSGNFKGGFNRDNSCDNQYRVRLQV